MNFINNSIRIGKSAEKRNAILKSFPNNADIHPAHDGPIRHPRSPAKARNANILTLAYGSFFAARLYVPGHIIPEANPQTEHPISDNTGHGEKAMIIKDIAQRQAESFI